MAATETQNAHNTTCCSFAWAKNTPQTFVVALHSHLLPPAERERWSTPLPPGTTVWTFNTAEIQNNAEPDPGGFSEQTPALAAFWPSHLSIQTSHHPSTPCFCSSDIPKEREPMKSFLLVRSQSQTSTDRRRSLSLSFRLLQIDLN